jgi:hypothetical protein
MGTIWRIAKDGLKAFLFWLVASVLMIYFWGDFGKVLSYILGFVFILSFCVLRITEIAAFAMSLGRRPQSSPNVPPPYAAPGSAPQRSSAPPPPAEPAYCPKCGSAWVPGARACANCG